MILPDPCKYRNRFFACKVNSFDRGGRIATAIISVLLAIIVWVAFSHALRNGFVDYDDPDYVSDNPKITNGLTLQGIQWAFTHVHASNWHPLTTISHMLDCQFYGLQPWGHHLTNILLHTAAAILLFLALRSMTGAVWPSAFVAAVFAVHPLRVESVAWVSERKDVLSGVFLMLILWAYAGHVRSNRVLSWMFVSVVILFAFGLMCKPTLVTLPFILLLLDYWPLNRGQRSYPNGQRNHIEKFRYGTWSSLVVEKLPLFVLSAGSCVATLMAQQQALHASLKPRLEERIINGLVSYCSYLGQTIWPVHLAVLYPYPESNSNLPYAIVALLFLLIVSVVFFLWRTKYPFLLVGWLWYLGMLVPMIGIIQVGSQVRADRYTYLPQIGLYVLVAWAAMEFSRPWPRRREILSVAALLLITALITRSYLQTLCWESSETLWKHAIACTSDNYIAHNNLAFALLQSRRFDEAAAECRQSLKINANFAAAHNNLGLALIQSEPSGNGIRRQNETVDQAIAHYRTALQIQPDFKQAENNLGNALMQKGQVDEAIAQFRKALETDPFFAAAELSLANAFLKKGEVHEAIASYQTTLKIDPDYADAEYGLGNAFVAEGNYRESMAAYEAALRLRPDYFQAHHNLGCLLAAMGKTDEALEQFREALRINGDFAESHCYLGILLGHLGHREEAIAHLLQALRLKPDYDEAKRQLRDLGEPVPQ